MQKKIILLKVKYIENKNHKMMVKIYENEKYDLEILIPF